MKLQERPTLTTSSLLATFLLFSAAEASAQTVVSGTVDLLSTPPLNLFRDDPGHTSDTHTILFQEQAALQLTYNLKFDVAAPGHYGGFTGNAFSSASSGAVPANTEFDVYILSFNDIPIGQNGDNLPRHASAGTIQFPANIIGVQRTVRSLKAEGQYSDYGGDADLGTSLTLYPGDPQDPNGNNPHRDRGLEPGQAFTDTSNVAHREELWIHDDLRRLSFEFIVNKFPDQIRVITAKHSGASDPIQIRCVGDSGCPCGFNTPGADQAGCLNSTQAGARLRGTGSASLATNDLQLTVSGMPANRFGIVYMGPTIEANPPVFGDGLRCVSPGPTAGGQGGGFLRLPVLNSGSNGTIQYNNVIGHFGAGFLGTNTWGFQAFYRDPANTSCTNAGFNLSNALTVTFN